MPENKYKLSSADHERVYQELEAEMLSSTTPADEPRVVILGGQPGAGKSNLIKLAQQEIFKGDSVATINGDDYREAHPHSKQILKENDKEYATNTDPDVREWTRRLLDSAIKNKRNIIFEGTMRNPQPLMSTIEHIKEQGYKIDIMIMAVQEKVSRLGVIDRYEKQKERNGYGRLTSMESHDEAARNLPNTAAEIEQKSPIDSISVYNRACECLYRNDHCQEKTSPGKDVKTAIRSEVLRPLSVEEQEIYKKIAGNALEWMGENSD